MEPRQPAGGDWTGPRGWVGGPVVVTQHVLEKRRVVITGIGAVTPLGNTRDAFWEALVTGRSGVALITAYDSSKLHTHIAAEVKNFDPDALLGRKEARRMDRFTQFAFVAAEKLQ